MKTTILNNAADFAVKFPDGTLIMEASKSRYETYKKTLQKIGVDRVAQFALTAKTKRHGEPYVNKLMNSKLEEGGYKQELVDGYYVVCNFSALNMARFLRDLSIDLDLGLTIYNPCKTQLANKI